MTLPFDDQRFWAKVDFDGPQTKLVDGPCWLWTASTTGHDPLRQYGQYKHNGTMRSTHRYAWEQANCQLIPDELTIDHLCRNTLCVRPSHLECVTLLVNIQRASKTHCKNGHKFDAINNRGHSVCKTCASLNSKRFYQNKQRKLHIESHS